MRKVRINLFVLTTILVCIGIVMVYSASSIYAFEKYKDGLFFLKRQIIFAVLGEVLMFITLMIDYRKLTKLAKPLLLASLVLLILVLIPGIGREVAGARRWFRFKFISFQPSELANLAMIIYISDFITRKQKVINTFWKGFIPPILVLGVFALLILIQPDLGMVVALFLVVMIMLIVSGIRLSYILSLLVLSIPLLYMLIFSVPYRKMRIMAFLNPWHDPKGSGFQIIQSQIALGSGGIFGVGLGQSKQKLFYLPAAHTDFIFSIIGEELGIIGTLSVVIIFMLFIWYGLKIIKNASNRFGYFLGLGLLLSLTLKAVINIGVSCGLLPTKGLPLPFISYGGSSLVFDMIGVGLLLNIARTGEYP